MPLDDRARAGKTSSGKSTEDPRSLALASDTRRSAVAAWLHGAGRQPATPKSPADLAPGC